MHTVLTTQVWFTNNTIRLQLPRQATYDMNAYGSQASNVLALDFDKGHNAGEGIVVNGELIPWFGTWCVHPADMVRRDNTSDVMLYVLTLHEANDNTYLVGTGGYSNTLWYATAPNSVPAVIHTASAWLTRGEWQRLDVLDAFSSRCTRNTVATSRLSESGRAGWV